MNALTFKIMLHQPLLIGQVGAGEENSSVSVDYIAGSAIRGALIGRYIEANGDFDLVTLPTDATVRELFFNEKVAYLNAYLQDDQGHRTLPTPYTWKVEKDETELDIATVVDAAIGDINELKDPKTLNNNRPYCALDDEVLTLYKPKRHSGLHNASTERYVKRESDSFVFRYDALAAGQTFCGAILSEDTTLLTQLETLLQQPDFFLGGSRSAGYGHTGISDIQQIPDWPEYVVPTADGLPDVITLTLLSDAILRNAQGQATMNILAVPTINRHNLKPQASFMAAGLTGGFNRKWGLPLPQTPVIKAGSVWVFPHTAAVESALQTLVTTGIGERRAEGFGRVAVNWQQHAILKAQKPIRELRTRRTVTLSGTSQTLATRMATRLYRQQLDQILLNLITDKLTIGGRVPENSQLARLRIVVRRAWREKDGRLVLQFLRKLKPIAKNQYLQAQIERQSLLAWLEKGWQNDTLWKDHFQNQSAPPQVGDAKAVATAELKLEYSARLIDALCAKAVRTEQAKAKAAPAATTKGAA